MTPVVWREWIGTDQGCPILNGWHHCALAEPSLVKKERQSLNCHWRINDVLYFNGCSLDFKCHSPFSRCCGLSSEMHVFLKFSCIYLFQMCIYFCNWPFLQIHKLRYLLPPLGHAWAWPRVCLMARNGHRGKWMWYGWCADVDAEPWQLCRMGKIVCRKQHEVLDIRGQISAKFAFTITDTTFSDFIFK